MTKSSIHCASQFGFRACMCVIVSAITLIFSSSFTYGAPAQLPQLPFNSAALTLIDEVDLGSSEPGHNFRIYPDNVAMEKKEVLGKPCLILPDSPSAPNRFVTVKLGEGKGLVAGVPYVLQIEYPEDAPRSMIIQNTANETRRSFHTGHSVGDALKMPYVSGNPESVEYPLSGKWQKWTCVFEMHPHFGDLPPAQGRSLSPSNGFTIALAHYKHENDPVSTGLAAGKIRLYAAPDWKAMELPLRMPPAGLPQRHLFWREEMSDGIVFDEKNPAYPAGGGTEWFAAKMRLMKFLGMNTFSKDLLEFGHNQGWDSSKYGSNDWVNQTKTPQLWSQIVSLAGQYKLNILPMYEYCGSIGGKLALGPQKRCKTLGQAGKGPKGADNYTHIWWSEKANADVTDPDTVEDLRKMLEITITQEKDKAKFLGAWIRPRNSGMPVSFSDRCLKLFGEQTKRTEPPTRDKLKSDKALYNEYIAWWHLKRVEFLAAIRDYLRQPTILGPESFVMFTGDPTEPGNILSGGGIVTENASLFPGEKTVTPQTVLSQRLGWKGLTGVPGTWGGWEWQHSIPAADPENFAKTPGVILTMPFSRLYSVSDPQAMEAFRTPDGLAMIRHYPLNENCFSKDKENPLGYFITDFEEAGPYCVLAEARALAWGDPRFIGYLTANSMQRGFPEYVRAFYQAFLALPALPSKIVDNATSSKQVVVRQIPTPKSGTWYAVINTGLNDAIDVQLNIPASLVNYITGTAVSQKATISMYPGQVLVFYAKP